MEMLETWLLELITGIAGLVALLVTYARWHYGTLEKLGIPVAKPYFILGSDPDGHKIVYQYRDMRRFYKYGPVFGVYEGRKPRVFIADPDMIRRIMLTDFDHFYDRTVSNWGCNVWDNRLDFLSGEKWKTVRSSLVPMFTASRIRNAGKLYAQLMDKHVKELRNKFKGDSIKINLKQFMAPVFVEFTLDHFMAMKLSGEGDIKKHYIYKMVLDSVNDTNGEHSRFSFLFTLKLVFRFLSKIFNLIPFFKRGTKRFLLTLDHVIKIRRGSKIDKSGGKDFIDVMISMLDNVDSSQYKRLGIDKACIQAQAFEMFIAGFDATIGTLSLLPYYLAKNPEIQEKVLAEIDHHYNIENTKVDDAVPDLPYLTACIKEVIRLSPPFHRIERTCMKEWTYRDKGIYVTIPRGMSVTIPVWTTNRSPEAFKNPEEFRPERYYRSADGIDGSAANKRGQKNLLQYSMSSFGHGPKSCPGSRMGIEMVKAGIARILQEFKFECRADTKAEIQEGMPMLTRYKPIYLNVVKRTERRNENIGQNLLFTLIKLV